jgi:hypothetical protein
MSGLRFDRRRRSWAMVVIVAVVAVFVLAACDQIWPPPVKSPAPRATERNLALLPGESPTVTPGPDLGEAWTTDPDPSSFVTLDDGTQVAPDQYLIMMDPSATKADAQKVADYIGGTIGGHIAYIGVWKVLADPVDAHLFATQLDILSLQPGVLAAAPVGLVTVQDAPDCAPALADKVYSGSNSDPYEMIGVREAWQALYASGLPMTSVHVGFLDTVLTRDPKGKIPWEFGNVTFAGDPKTTTDLGDHDGFHHADGTLGVLAADGQNGGIAGIASPLGSRLVISHDNLYDPTDTANLSKWTSREGTTYTDLTLIKMAQEIEAGATIVNASVGRKLGPADAPTAAMWKRFYTRMAKEHPNVLFVVAAGNAGIQVDGTNYFPGGIASPNVMTVGNVDNDGDRNWSSNSVVPGSTGEVTLGAPGDKAVWGIGADGKVQASNGGTSSATPMVTATAALIRSIDPTLSAAQIKEMIVESGDVGDAEVGGQTLRVDLALREAIDGVRAKSQPPLGPLTDAEIAAATQYCQISVTGKITQRLTTPAGATQWDLRASVKALAGPTSIALAVANRLRASNYRQTVTAPSSVVSWSVQAPKEGVGVTVTRLDNGYWLYYTLIDKNPPTPSPTPTATPTPKPTPKPSDYDCSNPPEQGSIEYVQWALHCTKIGT